MSTDDSWITTRITEARKHHSEVTDAASARIEELLNGQLSEGPLSQAELESAAAALIAGMVRVPPKANQ